MQLHVWGKASKLETPFKCMIVAEKQMAFRIKSRLGLVSRKEISSQVKGLLKFSFSCQFQLHHCGYRTLSVESFRPQQYQFPILMLQYLYSGIVLLLFTFPPLRNAIIAHPDLIYVL